MTPLAETLKPHMSLIVGLQVFLLGLAIFVGVLLVLRRLWRRERGPGERIQDPDQLAAEIHEEILRMEDLRNRLDPSYSLLGHDVSARPVSKKLLSSAESENSEDGEVELASPPGAETKGDDDGDAPKVKDKTIKQSAPPSEEYLNIAVKKATSELNKEITELNAQIAKLKEQNEEAKAQAAASGAAAGEGDWAGESGGSSESTKADSELQKEVQVLTSKLEDYQAFEDELALVKTYKDEVEKLRARIKEIESGQPQITDDDIASLFEEIGDGFDMEDIETTAFEDGDSEGAFEENIAGSNEPTLEANKVFKADNVVDSEKVILGSNSTIDNEPTAGMPEDPSPKVEAAPMIDEENAEALAELGEEGDDLLAQFEKVLSGQEENP